MEEELEIAEKQLSEYRRGRHKSTFEWIAIYGSLLYPGLHPHDAYYKLQDSFVKESGITYDDYRTALHNTNLDSEDRRRYVLGFVENQMAVLKKALDGNMDAISNFSELTENLNLRDRQRKTLFYWKVHGYFHDYG